MQRRESKELRRRQRQEASASASTTPSTVEDPLAANYGDLPLCEMQSKETANLSEWFKVADLNPQLHGSEVVISGRVHTLRDRKVVFMVVRQDGCTVQCVVVAKAGLVSPQMVRFAAGLSLESVVQVRGLVSVPLRVIRGTTQQLVEIEVRKLHCINRSEPLPFSLEDASRSEQEIQDGLEDGVQYARVNLDTQLLHQIISLRTPASLAIQRIQSAVENSFGLFMLSEGFVKIKTPKIIAGSSEGGADVFRLDYKGKPACLAQSPQLHKQMALGTDLERVYVIGPVFRAEDSHTHRHLCEFEGLDAEMVIKKHYSEIMDIVDRLFVAIFDFVNESFQSELEAVRKQYPFEPLKYLRKTLQLTFEEGIQMLKEAGVEVNPYGDLNTEAERKLGKLVLEKYGTEFYILHRFPLAVRPFYTMPCYEDPNYSNSFDAFIRGEEIISGAQRIHKADFLEERIKKCGIDVNSDAMKSYMDAFRYGMPQHGGFGAGLERVVMLFLGLDNIRKVSLFPRDPKRLTP